MQIAGKNMAAPAARANRNHVSDKRNCEKHGRPAKLEFRSWGDRHGELHAEKIVQHKDQWMASLDGDFKHFHDHELDQENHRGGGAGGGEYFPKFPEVKSIVTSWLYDQKPEAPKNNVY